MVRELLAYEQRLAECLVLAGSIRDREAQLAWTLGAITGVLTLMSAEVKRSPDARIWLGQLRRCVDALLEIEPDPQAVHE